MKDCPTSSGGKFDGLVLMQNNLVTMTVLDVNENCIDAYFSCDNQPNKCRISGIYGCHIHYKKYLTCSLLSDLYNTYNFDNWIVCKDFNIVTSAKEKCGGNPIDLCITNIFIDTIDKCNLNDIEYTGDPFTLTNSQWNDNYI